MNPPPAEKLRLKQGITPCAAGDTIKMNIATPLALKPALLHERANFPIHEFIEAHQCALHHAAHLLGGKEGVGLVDMVADALSREMSLSRRTIGLLRQLKSLLFLEHVDDIERAECGHFAAIDPADPVVEDICLLADGLQQVLLALNDRPVGKISTIHRRDPGVSISSFQHVDDTSEVLTDWAGGAK